MPFFWLRNEHIHGLCEPEVSFIIHFISIVWISGEKYLPVSRGLWAWIAKLGNKL